MADVERRATGVEFLLLVIGLILFLGFFEIRIETGARLDVMRALDRVSEDDQVAECIALRKNYAVLVEVSGGTYVRDKTADELRAECGAYLQEEITEWRLRSRFSRFY